MKILVSTLCEAVNFGAFLQAYSLKCYLEQRGHRVYFLKTYSKKMIKTMLKSLYSYDIKKQAFKYKFRKGYFYGQSKLRKTFKHNGFDCLIIGSDEVWQLKNSTAAPKKEFFGIGIDAKKKIVYAACANSTNVSDISKIPFVVEGIKNLDCISVRDEATYNAYKPYIDQTVEMCLDPTFLINIADLIEKGEVINQPYLLVYTYGFSKNKIDKVRTYAKQKNFLLIAVGQKFDWCDISIPGNPFTFLWYIQNATAVVTDTFHGTILSIQLHKNVFVYGYKEKVKQVLRQFEMESRNLDEDDDLESVEKNQIDYEHIETLINNMRRRSVEFLENGLNS